MRLDSALTEAAVGWTGVTRRGRVAPDCAEASAEHSRSAAVAQAVLFVSLFIDGKCFITRRAISTFRGRGERGRRSDVPRAGRVRRNFAPESSVRREGGRKEF